MLIFRNDINQLQDRLDAYFVRSGDSTQIRDTVARVLADIKSDGDAAVCRYTKQFDGAEIPPEKLRVQIPELEAAAESITSDERSAIEESIHNVQEFHRRTLQNLGLVRIHTEPLLVSFIIPSAVLGVTCQVDKSHWFLL